MEESLRLSSIGITPYRAAKNKKHHHHYQHHDDDDDDDDDAYGGYAVVRL
jgi:hypothetical protein